MPKPRVVVVGSINVDLVVSVARLPTAGETVAGGTFAPHGGGKSANQAVAAARLGADVTFVGAAGEDEMGAEAVRELADEGIDVSHIVRVDAPTGVALIVVDTAGENQVAVASGANAALDADHVRSALREILCAREEDAHGEGGHRRGAGRDREGSRGAGGVGSEAAGGVVLLGHEVSAAVVTAAADAANAAGWHVILNPAPARELPDAEIAVLTPNASEAAELTGEDDPETAARVLARRAAVLITLGADGALLLEEPGGEPIRLPATEVDVVDTTGAGDTVNGALAAELAAGRSLEQAARFALKAAALSTRAAGARGGMPRREDVG